MSERNKRFRSHCNMDVLLNKKDGTVSVNVAYKDEMFSTPLSLKRYRYFGTDIIEELQRQGISVDQGGLSDLNPLDNTSKKADYHSASLTLSLSPSNSPSKEKLAVKDAAGSAKSVKKASKRTTTKTNSTDE